MASLYYQLPRHLIISAVCGFTELVGFYFLYQMVPLWVAYVVPFSVATSIGYFGHNYFTFQKYQATIRNAIKFLVQVFFVMGIGYVALKIGLDLGVDPFPAKIIQLLIGFSFNFSIGKYLTFR